jgi:hypothetical protein
MIKIKTMRTVIYQIAGLMILAFLTGCKSPESTSPKKVMEEKLVARVDSGFIDKSGTLVVRTNGRFHGNFSDNLARVWATIDSNNTRSFKWGYIDVTGKYIVQPLYAWALPFSEGLAAVNLGGEVSNVRNLHGSDVIWADIKGGEWSFIDIKGQVILTAPYTEVGSFCNGLAPVKSNDKWGYIDKSGNLIVPPQFDNAGELNDGMGAVLLGNKWGFIDKSGKEVIKPIYSSRIELMDGQIFLGVVFSEGLAWVDNGKDWRKGKKWGVIDTTGTFVIEPQFDSYGRDFRNDLSAVNIGNKLCIINKFGQIVAETEYDDILEFSEGIASFKKAKKWGAIDTSGKVIIEPKFDNPFSFSQSMASIENGEFRSTSGYIDKSGAFVIPAKDYGDAWEFQKVYLEVIANK